MISAENAISVRALGLRIRLFIAEGGPSSRSVRCAFMGLSSLHYGAQGLKNHEQTLEDALGIGVFTGFIAPRLSMRGFMTVPLSF